MRVAVNTASDEIKNTVGVLPYNINTVYNQNDVVVYAAAGGSNLYRSVRGNNMGNALSDTTYWECFSGTTQYDEIISYISELPSSDEIDGLVISKNSTSPTDTIDVSAGSCFDSTKAKVLKLSSTTSKQNSSQATSTTYYVYLIAKSDLSVYDILITTSSSSPTLPTDYVYYRQIGSYTTDGSGHIYTTSSDRYPYPDYPNGISKTNGELYTATVDGVVTVSGSGGSSGISIYIEIDGVRTNWAWVNTNNFDRGYQFSAEVKAGHTYKAYSNWGATVKFFENK